MRLNVGGVNQWSVRDDMTSYVVAAKRGSVPATAGSDWQALLGCIPEVRLCGGNPKRIRIEAPADAMRMVRSRLGADYRVEPVIDHRLVKCA
jgi:hypothetical protein